MANLRNPDPTNVESSIRDILSSLRASADLDTAHVLAAATNTYYTAMIRFRGNATFGPGDLTDLTAIWEILLNISKTKVVDFRPKSKAEPTIDTLEDG